MLTGAIAKVQNEAGYDEELVAFVDGTMWNALQNSDEVSRHLELASFKKAGWIRRCGLSTEWRCCRCRIRG